VQFLKQGGFKYTEMDFKSPEMVTTMGEWGQWEDVGSKTQNNRCVQQTS
jgi:hypothetical protein